MWWQHYSIWKLFTWRVSPQPHWLHIFPMTHYFILFSEAFVLHLLCKILPKKRSFQSYCLSMISIIDCMTLTIKDEWDEEKVNQYNFKLTQWKQCGLRQLKVINTKTIFKWGYYTAIKMCQGFIFRKCFLIVITPNVYIIFWEWLA